MTRPRGAKLRPMMGPRRWKGQLQIGLELQTLLNVAAAARLSVRLRSPLSRNVSRERE